MAKFSTAKRPRIVQAALSNRLSFAQLHVARRESYRRIMAWNGRYLGRNYAYLKAHFRLHRIIISLEKRVPSWSQPIPKYPAGTASVPGGLAIVCENGLEVVEPSTYPRKLFIPRISLPNEKSRTEDVP